MRNFSRPRAAAAGLYATLIALTGAASAAVPLPNAQLLPNDPGTGPADRNVPFLAWHEDLSADGYQEQEILLSGTANTYVYTDDAAQSTAVEVATSGNPYTTRVLLRHPANPADFNGVVYLEILNATARYDGAPMWNFTYPSIIADGAAWVGVTYSDTTARFMRDIWGTENFPAPAGAQPRNRSRYATLNVPTRAYTWDILNQAAALLKADSATANPLAGYGVDTIIATGYSQSARYVTTLSNSFYPTDGPVANDPVIDGFIIAAGGPVSSTPNGAGFNPRGDLRNFEQGLAKTVRFTTESDIGSALIRQTEAERPLLRTYEVAGAAHVDLASTQTGAKISEFQFGVSGGGGFGCDLPLNPIRTGIPLSAIQHRLARWIQLDELPPASRFIDYDEIAEEWIRDADGNVLGGVRPARIEVPLGAYSGDNPYSGPSPSVAEIFCADIIGGFDAFTQTEVENRYGNRMFFVVLTWWSLFSQWLDGFALPVDAPTIMDETKAFEGLPE